jgi:hypothetical protein
VAKLDLTAAIVQAAADFVASRLRALGFDVSPAAITARVEASGADLSDLAIGHYAIAVEVCIVACQLASPDHPLAPAHAVGLRPSLGWGWEPGERLFEELEEAVEAAVSAAGGQLRS